MADLVVTITVPDADKSRIINGAARQTGWTDLIHDEETEEMIPNPVSKGQHLKNHLKNHLKLIVKRWEAGAAKDQQAQASETEVEAIDITVV